VTPTTSWPHCGPGSTPMSSDNDVHRGDLAAAPSAIKTRAIVMPSTTDFVFQIRDSAAEVAQMPDAELRPIPSTWGHVAGFGANPADNEYGCCDH